MLGGSRDGPAESSKPAQGWAVRPCRTDGWDELCPSKPGGHCRPAHCVTSVETQSRETGRWCFIPPPGNLQSTFKNHSDLSQSPASDLTETELRGPKAWHGFPAPTTSAAADPGLLAEPVPHSKAPAPGVCRPQRLLFIAPEATHGANPGEPVMEQRTAGPLSEMTPDPLL